jgi:phage terminase large subunit GpA-like protein
MKGDFFAHLKKEDPEERGYVHFARGFEDEVYRMITSEVRVLVRSRTGVVTSKWDLVEPSRRNEALDAMNYAEAAARRKGWVSMTEAQWDELAAKRGVAPEVNQLDLFEAASRVVADAHPSPSKSKEQKTRPRGFAGVAYDGN